MPSGHYERKSPVERFWAKVQKSEGCWEWMGSRLPRGYGRLKTKDGIVYTSRFSWELHFGEIPEGLNVLHECDNPPCVRPDHLFLGTQKQNMQDCANKGRLARGDAHSCSKLNSKAVLFIRKYYTREYAQDLAELFGVSRSHVHAIARGRPWAHLLTSASK